MMHTVDSFERQTKPMRRTAGSYKGPPTILNFFCEVGVPEAASEASFLFMLKKIYIKKKKKTLTAANLKP